MRVVESTQHGRLERQILIGMIVNKEALGVISSHWESGMFSSKWANIIGKWCVDYFKKYGKAPYKAIGSLFEAWAEDRQDSDPNVELIDKFLNSLSDEYKTLRREINPSLVVDQAAIHFTKVRLAKLNEKMQEKLEVGDVKEAQELLDNFKHIQIGVGAGIPLISSKESLMNSFSKKKNEPIIYYPGALGEFFSDTFTRDAFVSFEGPEKRGKSWWLMDVAWRGMMDRCKVAFFSVGDMSEEQVIRRFAIRAARQPMKPKLVRKPVSIEYRDGDDHAKITDYMEKNFEEPLKWQTAWKRFRKWTELRGGDAIKISIHPNRTISAAGLRGVIQVWQNEGWNPDVVVIDYADILASISTKENKIDQIDETWAYLRRLSQELHCCVVTATQTNKDSYKAETIGMQHFSNNKAKRAHVTASIGLNQKEGEKEAGIYRLNYVVRREAEFSESRCVHVAACLSIGNPAVCSTM